MSKPKTVHTIESLLARCIEDGECMVWGDYCGPGKTPLVHQDGKMVGVRKLLCALEGREIRGKFFACSCGTPGCVLPAHIIQRTPVAHMKKMAKRAHEGEAAIRHRNGIMKWRRANPIKLNEEIAAAIRNDTRGKSIVAAEYDVHPSMVWKIRTGRYWPDLTNPFGALIGGK
jgi:hypothetical protein